MNEIDQVNSLNADINKQKGDSLENREGIVSDKLPELALEMEDDEIVKLTSKWEKLWTDSSKRQDWEKQCEENEKYWLGKHHSPVGEEERAMVDNLIFESLETYLPQMTRRNPEPLVTLDNREESTPQNEKQIQKTKNYLGDLADKNKLRLKLKKAGRYWALYLLGVAKMGWGLDKDIPVVRIIKPSKLILDPDAFIDEDGYTGDRIGERRKMTASKLISILEPSKQGIIKDRVKDDLSTEIQFIEWWTPEYMCWKMDSEILLKRKNPHWNYDEQVKTESVDDYGNQTTLEEEVPGLNHFKSPQMPYVFLSVYNIGDRPMDRTSLISQNLSNQDLLNKRNRQIDHNCDNLNGGVVVSQERSGLTPSQARNVTKALRKGGAVIIPSGSPREAIDTYQGSALPGDVFNQLQDTRNRLRDIFGTRGSTPAGLETENTVRGKIMNRGLDTDRIGGGVSEYLEQFADDIYNWFLQLLYVYDNDFRFIKGATPPKVVVSVKEGSLLPKDSITISNQAIDLCTAGKMSTLDMYKRLEFPNPEEMAVNIWLEVNAPQLLYKDNPLIQQMFAPQAPVAEPMPEIPGEQPQVPQMGEQIMEQPAPLGEVQIT
jgi:hypothetical protein